MPKTRALAMSCICTSATYINGLFCITLLSDTDSSIGDEDEENNSWLDKCTE